ncbi:MAG: outer membrane protein assembly factor BamB [Cocleimonas sp.]
MNSRFHLFIVAVFIVLLSGCSQINKKPKPIVLKPLEAIKTTLKTTSVWQVNTVAGMGENKLHSYLDKKSIYIAGGTTASAWQTSNGKAVWKTNVGETITAGVNGTLLSNRQARKTIKPFADQVFIGTSSGNAIALDAKTGKIQWIERLTSEVLSVSPSENGRVAFRTVDGKLHGLTSATGELVWQRSQKTPALTQLGAGVPLIVSNIVIAGFDNGKVAAYDLQTGQKLWEVILALPSGNSDLEQIVDVDGKIKALGNALFANSLNGSTVGINMESGKEVWAKSFSSPTGIEANSSGLFSSDDKGNVWAFDPQSGDPVWSLDDLQRRQPSVPMIVNNTTLVVTDSEGNIHFIKAETGKFIARQKGDPKGYSVEATVSGKHIYLIGKSGLLSKYSL